MIKEKVIETIKKEHIIENGDKIVLGVSGGPDSITMLHVLYEIQKEHILNFEMVVAHIHHGLRDNADIDESYVKSFCEKLKIPCFVFHANVAQKAKQEKKGLEETGREVRYQFFEKIMEETGSNKIAIAHNYNDSIETIIMHIIRGCGIRGLEGMDIQNGKYIRPLLTIKREEIEAYCAENALNPRHDETNDENIYTRNKIRNIVIPYIQKELNSNVEKNLQRLAEIAREESEYIDLCTKKAYENICLAENILKENVYNNGDSSTIILDLKKFNAENVLIQKQIILLAIYKIFGTTKGIEKIHIDDIIQLCHNNIGNKFLMPNTKMKIVIKNKKIHIMSLV